MMELSLDPKGQQSAINTADPWLGHKTAHTGTCISAQTAKLPQVPEAIQYIHTGLSAGLVFYKQCGFLTAIHD